MLLNSKYKPRKIGDILNKASSANEKKGAKVPLMKTVSRNDVPEEEDLALKSSRTIIETWAFKTSQSKGLFQSNIYHLRYFKLNLMMEELKVYEKPEGKLKHAFDLS